MKSQYRSPYARMFTASCDIAAPFSLAHTRSRGDAACPHRKAFRPVRRVSARGSPRSNRPPHCRVSAAAAAPPRRRHARGGTRLPTARPSGPASAPATTRAPPRRRPALQVPRPATPSLSALRALCESAAAPRVFFHFGPLSSGGNRRECQGRMSAGLQPRETDERLST